ncbi:ATP-binding protein [Sphingomonas sp.]|uniref:sensor histidine kinase n=1 Tax=Sphingomonas sp. TaxID=28214 RepID=UPI000DB3E3D1|nr:ATP-binding protein [Sphingomonas sp.]PZU09769.1 MAG: sensor histidine kinase [Sphingomonas sp.]
MQRLNLTGAALLAALVVSLLALLAAFLLSMAAASRHLERAMIAQSQLAAVSRIEALVAEGASRAEVEGAARQYRASIDAELRLLEADPAAIAAQREEGAEADRLVRLALAGGPRDRLIASADAISRREQGEAAGVAAAMTGMRTRTTILASILAGFAISAALAGSVALTRANRRLAGEVEARTADLRAIDASRRLFFAKASHELRTPVTVMRGEAEVSLADPGASIADLRAALSHVVANADFLGHRIEELLGLSSAADGRLHLDRAPIDLVALVAATGDAATAFAHSSEVRLALAAPSAPLEILGDARWLGQALLAVLDNGVKFSPIGGTLSLSVGEADGQAAIEIVDQGAGVMPADLPRLFDAYYQAGEGRMRGGTGLGLALARWVVEQHGGAIRAANDPAGGCRIAISLPLAPFSPQARAA